jgi:D-glycero-alpha-D-manno-heptose-7-phosphate kinase
MTYVASHVSGSFSDWQQTATSAYELERLRLRIPGGCQDHYAAVFPGFNVFEFEDYNRARIIPLENKDFLKKLQENSTLVWTGVSRNSGEIIKAQISRSATGLNIDALNKQKELVDEFCAAFKIGDLHQTANVLTKSWKLKKEYAMSITNKELNEIYDVCIAMGAIGGKLLGAGGGGYFLFISKPSETETFRQRLMEQFQNIENIEMSKSWIHG